MFMMRFVFFCIFLILLACSCASTDETERTTKIMQENPHWDQATVKKLVKYQIEPGMTTEMVTAALGTPTRKSMEEEEEVWEYYSYAYHPLV